MQRGGFDVGDIHRHLGDAIFVNIPSDGLAALQGAFLPDILAVLVLEDLACQGTAFALLAAFLTHVEGNRHSPAGGCGVEVVVDSHEEVPGSHVDCAAPGDGLVVSVRSEIRLAGRIGYLLRQGFIFPGPADGEVLPFRLERCRFITVARDAQVFIDALGKASGEFRAFLEGDAGYRYERQNVAGSRTRMCSVMLAHVDDLHRTLDSLENCLQDSLRASYEGHHGPVGGFSRIHVKDLDPFFLPINCHPCICNCLYYLVDDNPVTPFAEIGHTFYDLFHFGY